MKVANLNADKVDGLDSTQLVIGSYPRGGRLIAIRQTGLVSGPLLTIPGMGVLKSSRATTTRRNCFDTAGSVVKRGTRNHGCRYYDDTGRRRYQGGFETRSAAAAWLREQVDEVLALRRGDITPLATGRGRSTSSSTCSSRSTGAPSTRRRSGS